MIALEVVLTGLLCVLGLYASPVNLLVASDAASPAVLQGQRVLLSCAVCKSTLSSALMPLQLSLATILVNCSSASVMATLQGLLSEDMVVACHGCAGAFYTTCQCAC